MNKEEELKKFVQFLASCHRGCEDGWYACPKSPDYIQDHEGLCDCWAGDAEEILKKLYGN